MTPERPSEDRPSRAEVQQRISSLYDRAENATGNFNATRAMNNIARTRRGSADWGRSGGSDPAVDRVTRKWFDAGRAQLGPIAPAVLPPDRMPKPADSPAAARGGRPADAREGLALEAGRAPRPELPAGPAAPAPELPAAARTTPELPAAASPVPELTARPMQPPTGTMGAAVQPATGTMGALPDGSVQSTSGAMGALSNRSMQPPPTGTMNALPNTTTGTMEAPTTGTVGVLPHRTMQPPSTGSLGTLPNATGGAPATGTMGVLPNALMQPPTGAMGALPDGVMQPATGTMGVLPNPTMQAPPTGSLSALPNMTTGAPATGVVEAATTGAMAVLPHRTMQPPPTGTMGVLQDGTTGVLPPTAMEAPSTGTMGVLPNRSMQAPPTGGAPATGTMGVLPNPTMQPPPTGGLGAPPTGAMEAPTTGAMTVLPDRAMQPPAGGAMQAPLAGALQAAPSVGSLGAFSGGAVEAGSQDVGAPPAGPVAPFANEGGAGRRRQAVGVRRAPKERMRNKLAQAGEMLARHAARQSTPPPAAPAPQPEAAQWQQHATGLFDTTPPLDGNSLFDASQAGVPGSAGVPGAAGGAGAAPGPVTGPATGPAVAESPASAYERKAAKALAFARAQIGKPCVWGATGPGSYDCSSLTQAAWRASDVALPRTTHEQAGSGAAIELAALQPGDLIFFYGEVSHVGLYTGNGTMIHAPSPGASIQEESIFFAGPQAIHSAIRPA
ncbi:NlpC/P60 family protein [Streptomyces sp. NPDC007920]|uniref:C40 family peptidase n=1 Tax=Streptomyces sp. NPDC007920 TaxID=3364794 RepID=UPI0036F14E78